jgi:hypothetical protein
LVFAEFYFPHLILEVISGIDWVGGGCRPWSDGSSGSVAGELWGRCGNVAGTLIDRTRQTKADGLLLAVIVVFD